MDFHIPTIFWAGLNLIILVAMVLGIGYLIFYILNKLRSIDKRMENIERKIKNGDNVENNEAYK